MGPRQPISGSAISAAGYLSIGCRTIRTFALRACAWGTFALHCRRYPRNTGARAHLLQLTSCVNATQAGISMNDSNTPTNHRHKSIAGQGIVLLLGALLAGCGGGGGSSPPPVSPGPPPPPVPPPPTSTVPPLASPAVDLATLTRVGIDRWPAYDSADGGHGDTVQGIHAFLTWTRPTMYIRI